MTTRLKIAAAVAVAVIAAALIVILAISPESEEAPPTGEIAPDREVIQPEETETGTPEGDDEAQDTEGDDEGDYSHEDHLHDTNVLPEEYAHLEDMGEDSDEALEEGLDEHHHDDHVTNQWDSSEAWVPMLEDFAVNLVNRDQTFEEWFSVIEELATPDLAEQYDNPRAQDNVPEGCEFDSVEVIDANEIGGRAMLRYTEPRCDAAVTVSALDTWRVVAVAR